MSSAVKRAAAALAGLLAIGAACELGFWQLRRAAGKEALQRQIDTAARAAPETPDASSLRQPASLVHRHLRLRGTWVPDHVVYLDNRPRSGRAGFYVLMALRLDQPAPLEVIVDRGWLPRDPNERSRIAAYRTPDQVVEITGVALEDEPRLLELAAPGERRLGAIWQNFDFGAYARAAGRDPVRLIVRQDLDVASADDGLSRDWPDRGGALQGQIDRHHGYAFQWFALAATFTAFLLFGSIRSFRHARSVIQ